jgi:hypothetical protein
MGSAIRDAEFLALLSFSLGERSVHVDLLRLCHLLSSLYGITNPPKD